MFHGAGVESLTGVNNNICLLFIMVSFANVCWNWKDMSSFTKQSIAYSVEYLKKL